MSLYQNRITVKRTTSICNHNVTTYIRYPNTGQNSQSPLLHNYMLSSFSLLRSFYLLFCCYCGSEAFWKFLELSTDVIFWIYESSSMQVIQIYLLKFKTTISISWSAVDSLETLCCCCFTAQSLYFTQLPLKYLNK